MKPASPPTETTNEPPEPQGRRSLPTLLTAGRYEINAASAHTVSARRIFYSLTAAWLLSACSALPTKPMRATMFDFGPGPLVTQPATPQAPLPPVAVEGITTMGGALDNMAVLYRLAYADAQELRPYSQARWTMPPAQLIRAAPARYAEPAPARVPCRRRAGAQSRPEPAAAACSCGSSWKSSATISAPPPVAPACCACARPWWT